MTAIKGRHLWGLEGSTDPKDCEMKLFLHNFTVKCLPLLDFSSPEMHQNHISYHIFHTRPPRLPNHWLKCGRCSDAATVVHVMLIFRRRRWNWSNRIWRIHRIHWNQWKQRTDWKSRTARYVSSVHFWCQLYDVFNPVPLIDSWLSYSKLLCRLGCV